MRIPPHLFWLPIIGVILTLVSASCQPSAKIAEMNIPVRWRQDDLVIRDRADNAVPEYDILAVYIHQERNIDSASFYSGTKLQDLLPNFRASTISVRLDLLDLSPQSTATHIIAIDCMPGGSDRIRPGTKSDIDWDILISIPATGDMTAIGSDQQNLSELKLSVWRDSISDTITVSFTALSDLIPIYDKVRVQAFSFSTTENRIEDVTSAGSVSARAPDPTKYTLLFRNAFPAYTPAQALRRWDGAHTGPMGGRHGLYNILRISRNYQIPIFFLDLQNPYSISALDYVRGLDFVAQLEKAGIVNTYPHDIADDTDWIKIQPEFNGLSLDSRRELANSDDEIVIFGGDLPESTWGIPDYARSAFSYIKDHPWLTPAGASTDPAYTGIRPIFRLETVEEMLRNQLHRSNGPELAYTQSLLSGTNHVEALAFSQLRDIYTNELSILEFAIQWASQPYVESTCLSQSENGSPPACVLASNRVFALLDPRSGGLIFLFVSDGDVIHQLIGPGWQFSFGSGDPSKWDLNAGHFADPDAVHPAFARRNAILNPKTGDGTIKFSDQENQITYAILPAGIEIKYSGSDYTQSTTSIPLVLDPWLRFSKDWGGKFNEIDIEEGFKWEFTGVVAMSVTSNSTLSLDAFIDTRDLMGSSENPNRELPPGHYLPFPIAIANVSENDSTTWIKIELTD